MKKIAIQGIKGCFHHIAALKYFNKENIDIIECNSFKKLVEMLTLKKVNLGIMAIENSISGSIIPNYNLIFDYNIKILGEIYILIKQNLMAFPGQSIDKLHKIFSHPVALQQCTEFLYKYPKIKIYEYIDTAQAAYDIMKKKLFLVGAIAPLKAAQEYGLEILAKNIHNQYNNYTCFLIISSFNSIQTKNFFDKVSLMFKLPNTTGSLTNLLNIFKIENINMSKIQSVPIVRKPWEYYFYIDLIIKDINSYNQIKLILKKQKYNFSILGQYKNGQNL